MEVAMLQGNDAGNVMVLMSVAGGDSAKSKSGC
jgi:hypothetical protein